MPNVSRPSPTHAALPRVFFVCCLLLTGCVSTPQTEQLLSSPPASLPPVHRVEGVPFFPQEKYQCGPAALATLLSASGIEIHPEELIGQVYLPEKKGSFQVELLAAARTHGRIPYVIDPQLQVLLAEVEADHPVLVMQNLGLSWYQAWHYAVVAGYDLNREELLLRSGKLRERITPLGVFENTWRRSNYWGFVVLRPGELPAVADERKYFLTLVDFARINPVTEVEKAYRAGLQRWPDSRVLGFGLANLLYEKGDKLASLSAFRKLVQAAPDYAPAYNNLAQLLAELGYFDEAIAMAEQAVALGGPQADQYQETLESLRSGK